MNRRTTTELGSTPLIFATDGNKLEVVEALLKKGANVNGRGKNGLTPLCYAASHGLVEMARYLIAQRSHGGYAWAG